MAQGLTGYPLSWRGCVQHRSILSPRPAGLFLAQSPTYRARLRPASDPCCASVCTQRHRAHVHREMLLYTDMYQISARKIFRLNIYYKNKFNSWVTATWSLPGSCAGLVTARPVTSECTVYTGCPGSSPAFASLSHTHTEKIFNSKASNSQIKCEKRTFIIYIKESGLNPNMTSRVSAVVEPVFSHCNRWYQNGS